MPSCKYRGQIGCPQDFSHLSLAFLSVWPNELFFLLRMAFLCPWSCLSTKCPQLGSIQCLLEQSLLFSGLWSAGPVLGQGELTSAGVFGASRLYPHAISLELAGRNAMTYWDPRTTPNYNNINKQVIKTHSNGDSGQDQGNI